VKGHLVVITSIILLVAGLVTLNLNSAAWAKDDHKTDSEKTFRISKNINGKENNEINDYGNDQSDADETYQTKTGSSSDCDSGCQRYIENLMGTMVDLRPNVR
jgi:hypothetical protein